MDCVGENLRDVLLRRAISSHWLAIFFVINTQTRTEEGCQHIRPLKLKSFLPNILTSSRFTPSLSKPNPLHANAFEFYISKIRLKNDLNLVEQLSKNLKHTFLCSFVCVPSTEHRKRFIYSRGFIPTVLS